MTSHGGAGEDGSALVELTWLGVLLLIPLVWIVVSVFEVQVDQGIEDADPSVLVSCVPAGDCHAGGAVITVRVDSAVALPLLPDFFDEKRSSFALSSTHTVPIGRYQESGS